MKRGFDIKTDSIMRKLFTISLLASLLLCGCQITEPEVTEGEEQYSLLTATIDDGFDDASTRTSLDSKGNVLWKKGDQISAFIGSTGNDQYQVSDASEGKTTARLKKIPSDELVATTDISNNVAFYPYTYDAEIYKEEEGVSYLLSGITLPATQTYAEDSFGNGAFPMAAVTSSTTDMNLKFKNILGGIKFQLKGSARIASISIRGNADEILCGSANITVSTSTTPTIELTDADAKTVTLDCGTDGVQLNTETATSFVIALPPVVMASGFTATVTDTYGRTMEIKSVKSQEIRRSRILKITPALDYVGTVEDYNNEPFTITSVGSTTVALVKEGTPADITLEYRTAGTDWATYTIGTEISLTNGAILQFRAGEGGNATFSEGHTYDATSSVWTNHCYKIVASGTGKINASGNIMSLYDRTLSTTAMTPHGFQWLFSSCTHLVDASNLKLAATELAESCYQDMFGGCTSLTATPVLPVTTLASFCYKSMFGGCTSLTTAPDLPAESLASGCYNNMFGGCSNLTTASKLPATELASSCYFSMYNSCSRLANAPELPATTLAPSCYGAMFIGTAITTAPKLPATTLADECYAEMFRSCTSLTTAPKLPAETLASNCYNIMFIGCTGLTSAPELPATTLASQCYDNMFNGCISLTKAPALPATTMAEKCYHQMFQGCTGLTSAPELPATALAKECYQMMFKGCTGLTAAPELPATTMAEGCYKEMFKGCTGLTAAPALPAENLAKDCYSVMFRECSGLTTAPALPATTLAYGCYYQMFYNCSNLTASPELPATILADYCYDEMFMGCSRLTTASELPATIMKAHCYESMFNGCSSLTAAPKLSAMSLASYCYNDMFTYCANLTAAPALPATSLAEGCYSSMFIRCTGLTDAPALMATTLANDCYRSMFYGCTELTSAPELPATDLVDRCYEGMFQYCSNLSHIKALFTTEPSDTYTKDWASGVASDGTFVKNSVATWDVTGTNGVPEGWTVTTE